MALPHWILRSAFAALACWLLFVAWAQQELGAAAPAARGEDAAKRVLVVHAPAAARDAAFAANLAGRFGRAELRSFERYRAGDLARYDAAFVIPADAAAPEALLRDARRSERPLVWMGAADGLFADPAFAAVQGWRPAAAPAEALAVRYRGRDFPRDLRAPAPAAGAAIVDPARASVLAASIDRAGAETPWAVRSGNLFHLAEAPFAYAHEDDRYLVFADLLFDALAPQTAERHRAMARIDDVGPDANPRQIRALADLLAEEGVPFAIAVRESAPARLPDGRLVRVGLGHRPQLVRALHHAVARGAALVAERPSESAVARRIWHRARLDRPSVVVAVPAGGGRDSYGARYGRALIDGEIQFFPYEVVDVAGDLVLPENLGRTASGVEPAWLARGPEALIASAERNLGVRDGSASFSHHWEESPDSLRAVVRGVRALGYRFVGPEGAGRGAPAHAVRAAHRASPVAVAAASWVNALPPLRLPALVALLAGIAAVGLLGEALLRRLDRPALAQRAA